MTGIYDFTILGALYTYLFIFFRSASCEAAMVVGLGFDVTIPAQYSSQSTPFPYHYRVSTVISEN